MSESPRFHTVSRISDEPHLHASFDEPDASHQDHLTIDTPSPLETTPGQDVLRALLRAHGVFRRVFDPHLARFGLTGCQWGVLRALARNEARGLPPMRMNEVGAATFVQPPSMSATLTRMERQGLIERRLDPTDSRSRLVLLTPKAREAMARVLTVHGQWIDRVTSGLSPRECEQLRDLLTRLADHIEAADVDRVTDETETEAQGGRAGHGLEREGCEPPEDTHA